MISSPQWPVYCFLSARGENLIRRWLRDEKVPRDQVAAMQAKIDAFERGGPELNPGLIFGPIAKTKYIFKMKIKGNRGWVQLRPMLCYGPLDPHREVTILTGAIEKDSRLIPDNWKAKALENRQIVLHDPSRRRRERID